jgi:hypothetical protein
MLLQIEILELVMRSQEFKKLGDYRVFRVLVSYYKLLVDER